MGKANKTSIKPRHGRSRVGGWKGRVDPTYLSWQRMRSRCRNPNDKDYALYGGRGIKVCERWDLFENFLADMGERPDGKQLDRANNEAHYEPGNCRWSTRRENSGNRRSAVLVTVDGVTHYATEWDRIKGFRPFTVSSRIKAGWDPQRAVTTPVASRPSKKTSAA
jgi:hypothetical protein